MKKFRTYFSDEIQEFEVVKETEKQVIYITKCGREEKQNKTGSYWSWHDSKELAKNYLINEVNEKIESLKSNIDREVRKLSKIEAL